MKRKTFGKRLVDHQAIRLKLAEMARQIESLQDSIEKVTLQFNAKTDQKIMGGQCALLKVNASRVNIFLFLFQTSKTSQRLVTYFWNRQNLFIFFHENPTELRHLSM